MEVFVTLENINLLALMIENMEKMLKIREGTHILAYGHLLNHVFEYYGVRMESELVGTIKQALCHTTLVECECSELKARTRKSLMSDLLDQKKALKGQVEELKTVLESKDAEVVLLKGKVAYDTSE